MSPRSPGAAWLSGRWIRGDRASVPAGSPLVQLGVGLFETMRLVSGACPLLPLHLERLAGAAERVGLPLEDRDWQAVIRALARRNRARSGRVRLTLAPDFALLTCAPLPRRIARERREGIDLASVRLRWSPAELKSTSRLALWLAEREAGGEALLVAPGGAATETTRSNFWVVTERGVETDRPPNVLPGVARRVLLDAARAESIPVVLRRPRVAERERWREAFVSNALRGVCPVRSLDGRPLRQPRDGSIALRLGRAFDLRLGIRPAR